MNGDFVWSQIFRLQDTRASYEPLPEPTALRVHLLEELGMRMREQEQSLAIDPTLYPVGQEVAVYTGEKIGLLATVKELSADRSVLLAFPNIHRPDSRVSLVRVGRPVENLHGFHAGDTVFYQSLNFARHYGQLLRLFSNDLVEIQYEHGGRPMVVASTLLQNPE